MHVTAPIIAGFLAMLLIMIALVVMTFYLAMEITERLWWRKTLPVFPLIILVWGAIWGVISGVLYAIEVMV